VDGCELGWPTFKDLPPTSDELPLDGAFDGCKLGWVDGCDLGGGETDGTMDGG
jgi:hypothetical protein